MEFKHLLTATVAIAALTGVAEARNGAVPTPVDRQEQVVAAPRADTRRPVNVRIDLTITDQSEPAQPTTKTVSMLLADGYSGRVRSSGTVDRFDEEGRVTDQAPVELNADAEVSILSDGLVRAMITVAYTSTPEMVPTPRRTRRASGLSESIVTILTSGKPTLISEATDPASERRVSLEVTATIVR